MDISDFKKTVEQNSKVNINDFTIFVDKTQFLPLIASQKQQTVLLTRPRRFGKSFNLKMIQHFFTPIFDIDNDYRLRPKYGQNKFTTPYFKGGEVYVEEQKIQLKPLKIAALHNQFQKYHGKIPVLHANFINIPYRTNYETFKKALKKYISQLYHKHMYVALSTMLNIINDRPDKYKKELQFTAIICDNQQYQLYTKIQLLCNQLKSEIENMPKQLKQFFLIQQGQFDDIFLQESLLNLAKMIKSFYNRSVLVLVDQYDAGISDLISIYFNSDSKNINQQNRLKQQIEKVANLVSAILSRCGKGAQQYVYKCYMVGVTSSLIGHELSGFNNVVINSLYQPQKLEDFFGFTQTEVFQAIDTVITKKNLNFLIKQELFRNMKDYYNGYGQDKHTLFNPYSVTMHLKSIIDMKKKLPILKNYWLMSSWSKILMSVNITKQIYKLLSQITLEKPLQINHLGISYKGWGAQQFIGQIISAKNTQISLSTLFYLLISTGYLVQVINNQILVGFRLPNKEIQQHFRTVTLSGWLKNIFRLQKDANEIVASMSKSFYNKEQFQKVIRQQILKHIVGDCTESDFAAGIYGCLLMGGITKQFKLAANMEVSVENNKRLDTFFAPVEGNQGLPQIFPVIHEYKVNRSPTVSNESVLEAAMWQVFVNNYLRICQKIDIWNAVIVRAIVFWKNKIQNKGWMVVIKQFKIPKSKVAKIMAFFEVKNLIKAMNKKKQSQKSGETINIRRDFLANKKFYNKLLSMNKVSSLDQLINNELNRIDRQIARGGPPEQHQTYLNKEFRSLNIEKRKPQSQGEEDLQHFQQIVQILKDINWAALEKVDIGLSEQFQPQQQQDWESIEDYHRSSRIERLSSIQKMPQVEAKEYQWPLELQMPIFPNVSESFCFITPQSQNNSFDNSFAISSTAKKQQQQAKRRKLNQREIYFSKRREQVKNLIRSQKQQQQQQRSENDIWRNLRQNQNSSDD